MADAQHPDIDEAARLIAAAVYSPQPDMSGDIWRSITPERRRRAEDAAREVVRTLARPVEGEEVRSAIERLQTLGGYLTQEEARGDATEVYSAASLLARLAREKASAEQERDAAIALMAEELEEANARAAKDRKLAAAWLCDKLKAQTDLAVAREALAEIEVELGGSLHRAGIREIARRALAAAAGAEEPR